MSVAVAALGTELSAELEGMARRWVLLESDRRLAVTGLALPLPGSAILDLSLCL